MQEIKLDFCRSKSAPGWVAPLLLAVALAFAGDVAFSLAKNLQAVRKYESALGKLDKRSRAPAPNASKEEVAAARETMQRLALPWEKLFAALESAASDQVALLSIEPDPKSGMVTITGDSKDYLGALSYVLNLSHSDSLSRVQLARHEVKERDAQKTVNFSISAAWGGPKP